MGWGGDCIGTGACNVTLDVDRSVTATFTASCPAAPTWLRVSPVSQTRLDLLWQDNSTNESGFKVERKEGCCGPWTLLPSASTNATTYQSTGLKCGTTYAYRVWAFSAGCESAKTNEAAAATSACTTPATPTWLRVSAVSPTRIDLLWQDNSTNESGFKIERKEGCCGPWTLLPSASMNATTYQSTSLKCGTTYAYRVWAFNDAGDSAKTNEAGTTTQACP
jgi:predicted phage tail protein